MARTPITSPVLRIRRKSLRESRNVLRTCDEASVALSAWNDGTGVTVGALVVPTNTVSVSEGSFASIWCATVWCATPLDRLFLPFPLLHLLIVLSETPFRFAASRAFKPLVSLTARFCSSGECLLSTMTAPPVASRVYGYRSQTARTTGEPPRSSNEPTRCDVMRAGYRAVPVRVKLSPALVARARRTYSSSSSSSPRNCSARCWARFLRSRLRSRRCQRSNQVRPRCWSFHHGGEPPCMGRSTSSKNSLSSLSWPPGAPPGSRSFLAFLPTHPAAAPITLRAPIAAATSNSHPGALTATINTVEFTEKQGYVAVAGRKADTFSHGRCDRGAALAS